MSPAEYKTTEERHRILCLLEELWTKHPRRRLGQLISLVLPPGEKIDTIRDERMVRGINKELRDG